MEKKIIIHNAEFDISHINNELKLIGKKELDDSNVVDTLTLAREKYPGSNASLDALCKRFRIDNSRRKTQCLNRLRIVIKSIYKFIRSKRAIFKFFNTKHCRRKFKKY